MVPKNYQSELSYMLAKLFSMSLKESCFPDSWIVSSVFLVFKNVRDRCTAKIYRSFSLLSVVSKVSKKRLINRLADHLEKYKFFISCTVLGILFQLQNFWQLYLIELQGLLISLYGDSNCSTWYIQDFWQDLSSVGLLHKLKILWNFGSDIWSYFVFS